MLNKTQRTKSTHDTMLATVKTEGIFLREKKIEVNEPDEERKLTETR